MSFASTFLQELRRVVPPSHSVPCSKFYAWDRIPAFAADTKFHQRTPRVRLRNLGTTDKKSSRKIKYKKVPRVHGLKRKK